MADERSEDTGALPISSPPAAPPQTDFVDAGALPEKFYPDFSNDGDDVPLIPP